MAFLISLPDDGFIEGLELFVELRLDLTLSFKRLKIKIREFFLSG